MLAKLRAAAFRIRALFGQSRQDDDFHRELDEHLGMLTEENLRRGMPAAQAAREARLRLGRLTQLQEDHREHRGLPLLDSIWKDLRYAARVLRKSPGYTLVAILTLALGIGVNTALFTAFNAVALKPLPVRDPNSVVRMMRWFQSRSQGNVQYLFSYPEYLHYRDRNHVFSSLVAASWIVPVAAETAGTLHVQLVSGNYFPDLGIRALVGRTFLPEENHTPGTHPVVVLSHPYWRLRFNADPSAIGSVIRLNGTAFTIIGVTPEDFIGTGNPPQVPDFWAPLMMQAQLARGDDWLHSTVANRFQLFGRLKPGVGMPQAEAAVGVLASQFEQSFPARDKTTTVTLEHATFFGETNDIRFRALVALLMAVVGLVLLIACANLANVLLARASGRHREIAV